MDSIQRVVLAFVLAVAFAVPCMAREVLQARNWRTERMKFAAHTIGVNYAFMEAQRAGRQAADSKALFPNVWTWKKPGYTNICTKALSLYDGGDGEVSNLKNYPGYFEAGNAVLVTGVMAFTAVQQNIGAMNFMTQLKNNKPQKSILADPKKCLTGGYVNQALDKTFMRQMKYTAWTLDQSILYHDDKGSDYRQLVGVGDSVTYGEASPPSWGAPAANQEMCYIGDLDNPVADVAAQTAAGLATSAKILQDYGTAADQKTAGRWWKKAKAAYTYAKKMTEMHGDEASCTASSAASNCVGTGCQTEDEYGNPTRGTCILYENNKGAQEHMFVAAAAMWLLTGNAAYRNDADTYFKEYSNAFLYNWNNVPAQGVVLMSMAPDLPGAARSKEFYLGELKKAAGIWADCSNNGEGDDNGRPVCKLTDDGSAYPLDFPWGNTGSIMNGLCLSAVYQNLNVDPANSEEAKANRCFMHRQMGYLFNHKCSGGSSMCNTATAEGFSYMVGVGNYYPKHLHSRDAAYPGFMTENPDPNMLCGAVVSGPYAPTALNGPDAVDGPVPEGTDEFMDNRRDWRETEPAVDYTGGLICAMMGYAVQPEGAYDGCTARGPFTGRL